MGKNKQQKPETFEPDPNTQACATCWYGEENEHGSIKCPLEVEPMGRADRCGEWTATEPETKVVVNGVAMAEVETSSLSGYCITEEVSVPSSTTDFHLYKIEGFAHEFGVALSEVYNYFTTGGAGPVAINIKLTGFEETVKATMAVTLPHTIKLESTLTEVVRENGVFKIVLPSQVKLFEDHK
jgi:hypothetical protein